jgi:hypothetical protein
VITYLFPGSQIEALVNKLKQRDDGKVLLVLPEVYTMNSIPNAVRSSTARRRIIERVSPAAKVLH